MIKTLIAVDGSEHAYHAIEAVGRMGQTLQLEVVLLNVREAPVLYGDLPSLSLEQIDQAQQKIQDQLLADSRERAQACGLKVTAVRGAQGTAAAEIVRVASECGAQQIALGTRGMGALGNLFMGSVAQSVVHLAEVPVLLVK